MPFSKSQVDRAGRFLAERLVRRREAGESAVEGFNRDRVQEAEGIVEEWRRAHAKILSSVAANLRYYVLEHGGTGVAQRLKRHGTIVDKLTREEGMRLTQMADIGGVRAVLPTRDAVHAVARRLRRNWTVVRVRDYIETPKEDGYRALHLIVRRRGRLIEVQLRTPFQHMWANMVEDQSRHLQAALKSGEGPDDVLNAYRDLAETGAKLEAGGESRADLVGVVQAALLLLDTFRKRGMQ
ncbi:MAG: RelA/SpoT domain-containing protein [bacterium]